MTTYVSLSQRPYEIAAEPWDTPPQLRRCNVCGALWCEIEHRDCMVCGAGMSNLLWRSDTRIKPMGMGA